MMVLVDYSNIPQLQRGSGKLRQLVQRILDSLGTARLQSAARARVRLYGGWFEGNVPSRDAQAIIPDVAAFFPATLIVADGSRQTQTTTEVELAKSLLVDPNVALEDTFRPKGMPRNLKCEPSPFPGCVNPAGCVLMNIQPFLKNDSCPYVSCGVQPRDILKRGEQKLADTMLTADLMYLASRGETPIAVVSSDSDMWPGIRSALASGATIFHVHTMSGMGTPSGYCMSVGPEYQQLFP